MWKKKSDREIHHILPFMLIFNLKMTVFLVFIHFYIWNKAIFSLEFGGEM